MLKKRFFGMMALLVGVMLVYAMIGCDNGTTSDNGDPSNTPANTTVATPTVNPAAGTYATAQSVTLCCADSGATIYYTTDGSTPTTSSGVYSSAISITATTTIKAIAVKAGMDNSGVLTAQYTITGGNNGGSGRTITITGLSGHSGKVLLYIGSIENEANIVAGGVGTISNDSVTIPLQRIQFAAGGGTIGGDWTGTGEYIVSFGGAGNGDTLGAYFYTGGKSLEELEISSDDFNSPGSVDAKAPKYTFSAGNITLPLDQCAEMPSRE
ncbi:MAG: chitobiase/beta-hexosaminidase C-terminal domain-containing protein [Treponema sp.]|jgi:hypothetical protein|nr:chitobiase/beta-hexosaminidase C-terminal domain-containing protein [Treponema sp.]